MVWRDMPSLGLVATSALTDEAIAGLAEQVKELLSERYPEEAWEVFHMRDGLVVPPVEITELVDAVRARMLAEDWDLAVCVTELPLRLDRRPLVTHASPTHRVALVSLPALGLLQVSRRLLETIAEVVAVLLDDTETGPQRRIKTGNLRLILGMIRANRPWRLVARLSRALFGALAAASFALVTSDVWRLENSLDPLRLSILTVASIAIAVVALIAAHGLWERSENPRMREQVALFNLVTGITVTFGLSSLYGAVFAASLAVAAVLIDPTPFAHAVGHDVGVYDYLRLAWLTSSLATVGGALGGTLETDARVREAAYAYTAEDIAETEPD